VSSGWRGSFGILVGALSLRSHRDASTYYPAIHLCWNFLRRRVARNNFAQRSSSFQHRLGHSVSRRTGQFSSGRWNALDRGGDNLNFLGERKLGGPIFLVGSQLSVWRRLSGWYYPSARGLLFWALHLTGLSLAYL